MKKNHLLAGILLLALIAAVVSACKNGREGQLPAQETDETSSVFEYSTQAPSTEAPAPEETTASPYLVEDNSYVPVPMDKAAVLALYTEKLGEVKLRCPGFTRTQQQSVDNVTAGKGRLQLANRILSVAAARLMNAAGGGSETVAPHNDVAVLEKFPLYGDTEGCRLTDLSLLRSAACYTDGKTYKLVITLREQVNPDPENSAFSAILPLLERRAVAGEIAGFLSALDLDRYIFDFTYTDSEITCILDRDTGKLISLTQRMVVLVDIDLNLDLLLFRTSVIEAHGAVVQKLTFDDFKWE